MPALPLSQELLAGAVERIIEADAGGGFGFNASIGGAVNVRLARGGAVQIEIPANHDAEGRFWRSLAIISGEVDETGRGQGTWTCSPLDITEGGFDDRAVVAEGSWTWTPLD